MIYSKELREWASLIQSNVHAAKALKRSNDPQQQAGMTIRALMVEVNNSPAPIDNRNKIADKLWSDIDKRAGKMAQTLPHIVEVVPESLPITPDSDPDDIL